jgi:hypothetical protein
MAHPLTGHPENWNSTGFFEGLRFTAVPKGSEDYAVVWQIPRSSGDRNTAMRFTLRMTKAG